MPLRRTSPAQSDSDHPQSASDPRQTGTMLRCVRHNNVSFSFSCETKRSISWQRCTLCELESEILCECWSGRGSEGVVLVSDARREDVEDACMRVHKCFEHSIASERGRGGGAYGGARGRHGGAACGGVDGAKAGGQRGSWRRQALPGGSCRGPGWPWRWGEAGVGELAGVVAQANALRWLP